MLTNQTPAAGVGGGVIFIVGHRHPDTDSILSAIAYAHLKNRIGLNAVACRCGDVNPETKHLLEKFNQPEPLLIQDARAQMDETELDDPNAIPPTTILREVIEAFDDDHKVFTVLDDKRKLLGLVTSSTIGDILWGDTAKAIDLLSRTAIENITKAIEGRLLYAPAETRHNGKVSITAISANRLANYDLADRIVIMGNDTNAQIEAINKGAAILILVWTNQVAPMVLEAAREKKCGVILSGHGAMNTSRYLYYSIPVSMVMDKDNLVVFSEEEFVDDVRDQMLKSRFRAYPIMDSENRVMGLTSRYRILTAPKRHFILVDHNERKQAVPNIEKAEILEIVDHHRVGDITSDRPISFRNEPVGATATIIAKMYREMDIVPDKDIASLMLAAIIADTLNFRSPTTSAADHNMAAWLVEMTGLDTEDLAKEIFAQSSKNALADLHGMLNGDVKEFDIAGGKVVISQLTMYRLNTIEAIESELLAQMTKEAEAAKADLWLMVFTSARDNGSTFYAVGKGAKYIAEIYPNLPGESHSFQKGIVSRKNQIVPQLSLYLRNVSSWNS